MYNLKVRSQFQIFLPDFFGLISQKCLLVQNCILVLIFVRIMGNNRRNKNMTHLTGERVMRDPFLVVPE